MELESIRDPSPIRKQSEPPMPLQSEQLNELFAAISKAQGEFKVAGKRSDNPFFKSRYADLKEIVMAARPALAKYGLSVLQRPLSDEDGITHLYTILTHSSGQYMAAKTRVMPVKNHDPQSKGSALSYEKRNAYAAFVGVVSSDEDDDAEQAMEDIRDTERLVTSSKAPSRDLYPREYDYDPITREQLDMLEYELKDHPDQDMTKKVKDGLKLKFLGDMPKNVFQASIDKIRANKASLNKRNQ